MKPSLRFMGLAILLISVLSACGEDNKKPAGPMGPPPVRVGHPIQKPVTEWDTFTGRFQARDRVEVRARVSGYLTHVNFKDGQRVKKGDVLFVIDQRPFQIALDRAEADYALAQKNHERISGLISTGAVSAQEADVASQQLKSAGANLRDARLNMNFSEVRAPISGRASRHLVDVGNVVNGNEATLATVLTTLVADDPIDFYFEASEQELLKYTRLEQSGKTQTPRTGDQPVFVKLQDENEFTHEGKIDFLDNEVDRSSGTLQVRATFPNPNGTLVSGMFGRARLTGSAPGDAILVPDDVIGTNQTKKFVYVVGPENKLEARPVELGPLDDNNLRIIRSGLTPEDTIVMGGLMMLQPGMPVTPKMEDSTAPTPGTAPAPAAESAPPEDSGKDGTVPADVSNMPNTKEKPSTLMPETKE